MKKKKTCEACGEAEPRPGWKICDKCRRIIGWPTQAQIRRGVTVDSKHTGLARDGVWACSLRLKAVRDGQGRDTIRVGWKPRGASRWRDLGTTLEADYLPVAPSTQILALNAWLQGLAEEVEPLLEDD